MMRPLPFVALAAMLLAHPAHADPASDAKDLFERGRALRATGDCARAAPLFEKAAAVYPAGLGSVRNAAECEEAIGHFATAHRLWLDLKRAVMLSHEAKYDGWQADAEAAAARLEPKIAHLTIEIVQTNGKVESALDSTARAAVTVNGEPLSRDLVGTLLDRDPGTYVVVVAGEGEEPKTQSVDLAVGDTKKLRFLVHTPAPATTVATKVADPLPAGNGAATRRTIGWVALGVGAASLVGAAISLGVRQAALSDLETACPDYETQPCPTAIQPTVSRGTTASVLVDVFGIAGLAFALGGLALVVFSPSPARPQLSFGLGSVAARWSFQ